MGVVPGTRIVHYSQLRVVAATRLTPIARANSAWLPTAPVSSSIRHRSGPEGLHFVSAEDGLTETPWLLMASEVSGTTFIYEINTLEAMSTQ